jgi:hypothetical protein
MSARLIDSIVDAAHLDLDPGLVRQVKDMVCVGKLASSCAWDGREYLMQVVANAVNGVDVDKVGIGWAVGWFW